MKRNLLVTLADKEYIQQAKQLFSSAYWNAGWEGDYMLLSHEIPEEELRWFVDKGIFIKKCKPIEHSMLEDVYSNIVLDKFYLFTVDLKKWDHIIFLDADIIVKASLEGLLKTKKMASPKTYHNFSIYFPLRDNSDYQNLNKEFVLKRPAFNSGVMSFSTDIIKNNTFDELLKLYDKYKNIAYGDDPIINLYFYKQWEKAPIVYNIKVNYSIKKTHRAIILHFENPFKSDNKELKPWNKKNPFYKEWKDNLEKADLIDLKNIPNGIIWSNREIRLLSTIYNLYNNYYLLVLKHKFHYIKQLPYRLIGKIGALLKHKFPNIYFFLKKVLPLKYYNFTQAIGYFNIKNDITNVNLSDKKSTVNTKNTAVNSPLNNKNKIKIIQSYSQFDTGNVYAGDYLNGTEVYLCFYSFLLSYLTLNKYYGDVTMYCNQKAYDTLIKYIPYDNIIIKENRHKDMKYWSAYKLDVIADINEPFIHVDSDVFIFDDLFSCFINNQDKYDIIIQNILPKKHNIVYLFYSLNAQYLHDKNIMPLGLYDGRCLSCGVIGMNPSVKKSFIEKTDKVFNAMINEEVQMIGGLTGMILEELSFAFTAQCNNNKIHDILPYQDVEEFGEREVGNNKKYTHMWFQTKFEKENIDLIKEKIKHDFPEHYYLVNDYEKAISTLKIKVFDTNMKIRKFVTGQPN